MIRQEYRYRIIAFFTLVFVVDWFLYFRHAGHFFQGDTVFHLNHRALSVAEFLKEFIQLNPSGWYRPLANELIHSVLYPLAGLNPIPYRIPVYAVFIATTVVVYMLVLMLTRRHLAAALATFFFNVHTTNAYTTYDLGFMPELLFTFFYIAAVLAYLRYLENHNLTAYRLSVVCFMASLLSKEAAVTLPAALLIISFTIDSATLPLSRRLAGAVRSVMPHLLTLTIYLVFVLGYLQVQNFSIATFLDSSKVPNQGDYVPVLNRGVFRNADLAMTWAFNIPRGSWGQWRDLSPAMGGYLKLFRVLVLVGAAVLFLVVERRLVLFGTFWFWLTLLPALPLVSHFLPYYLFLPIVGLALIVGLVFAWLYDSLSRYQPLLAGLTLVCIFSGVLYAAAPGIQGDIAHNTLLGGASSLAENTLNDLKGRYPSLPAGSTLYFADAGESLVWVHDFGGLIRMAYGTKSLSFLYQSQGELLFPDKENTFVFEVDKGRLIDETVEYRIRPSHYMEFSATDLKLELQPNEVTAGRDKYTLTVNRLKNTAVEIAYTLNSGSLELFTVGFDADGKVTLDVSPQTRRGVYKFWGFKVAGSTSWFRAWETLTVR